MVLWQSERYRFADWTGRSFLTLRSIETLDFTLITTTQVTAWVG